MEVVEQIKEKPKTVKVPPKQIPKQVTSTNEKQTDVSKNIMKQNTSINKLKTPKGIKIITTKTIPPSVSKNKQQSNAMFP